MSHLGENCHPTKCCDFGSYECTIPMVLNGRVQGIDYCIAPIVAALNTCVSTQTIASCCGHGKIPASILLEDGREISIPVSQVVRPWERHEQDN